MSSAAASCNHSMRIEWVSNGFASVPIRNGGSDFLMCRASKRIREEDAESQEVADARHQAVENAERDLHPGRLFDVGLIARVTKYCKSDTYSECRGKLSRN